MKSIKVISILVIGGVILLTACRSMFDILPGPDDKDYVRRSDGSVVSDCTGGGFGKDWPERLEKFWKDNNLPYGTLDFLCDENNKPYMPENAPQSNKKK